NTSYRSDRSIHKGHGTKDLGPSDTSDSGSDIAGASKALGDLELDSDSDAEGTGERRGAGPDEEVRDGADIAPDKIERLVDDGQDQ
ncbi:MAG TPA: hypothetical protein VLL50_11895, partial [Usitatibacter sp.]|nr:hypothetical protein [Usitatibacter sp.]